MKWFIVYNTHDMHRIDNDDMMTNNSTEKLLHWGIGYRISIIRINSPIYCGYEIVIYGMLLVFGAQMHNTEYYPLPNINVNTQTKKEQTQSACRQMQYANYHTYLYMGMLLSTI